MKKLALTTLLVFAAIFWWPNSLLAQTLPDFGSVDVKELSDTQLQSLLRRSKSLGLETNDLIEMAQLQGLSLENASILEKRLTSLHFNHCCCLRHYFGPDL